MAEDAEKTIPLKEYQNLQRTLAAREKALEESNKVNKELLRSAIEVSGVETTLERIERGLLSFFDAETKHGDLDSATDFKAEVGTLQTRRTTEQAMTAARKELQGLISDRGVEWDDPKLAQVRTLWDAKNFSGALEAAKTALPAAAAKPADEAELNARVEAKVREILGDKAVDTGDTGKSTQVDRLSVAEIKQKLRDPEFRRTHGKKLYEDFRSGKLKLA